VPNRLIDLHRELHRIRRLRRNAALDSYTFQARALSIIRSAENRIRRLRQQIDMDRRRLNTRFGPRLSKEEARRTKDSIQREHGGIEEARWLIGTVKTLVDGLAFTFLPKWDMKQLAAKESAGFISGKRGLSLERRMLRMIATRAKRVAILNDLTHCLRYGDLTVAADPPLMIEAKSGSGETARDRRQERKANDVLKYLREDIWHNWAGTEWTMQRTALIVPERHHRRLLTPLIMEGRHRGVAVRRAELGVHYVALASGDRKSVERLVRRVRKPFVLLLSPDAVPPYYFPLSLSISDSLAWWLIARGTVSLLVIIDREQVEEHFAAKGLKATWDDTPRPIIGPGWRVSSKPDDSANYLDVSIQFFGRIAGEFLSLRWFADEVAARHERGPGSIVKSPTE
jgi:hypothetical protein